MAEAATFDDIRFEPLSDSNVPKDFDCGDDDLNDFILNDALKHLEEHVAVTTLVFYQERLVGFFSLAADCIALNKTERKKIDDHVRYKEYPALKICRLAICKDGQHRGVGHIVFNIILGFTVEILQPTIGARFISVDAYQKSEGFYEDLGFIRNIAEVDKTKDIISMRYDTEPIKPAIDS